MSKLERVVYYARESTDSDEQKIALENQVEMIESYIASREDWQLVDKFIDRGRSAKNMRRRPAFTDLYNEISNVSSVGDRRFDIIVVTIQSRSARNSADWHAFERVVYTSKIKLFFLLEERFYNPRNTSDKLISSFTAIIDEEYSVKLSTSVNASVSMLKNKGHLFVNSRIFGYDYVKNAEGKGELVVNEKEAEAVRFIFEKYNEGWGFYRISNALYEKGFKADSGNRKTNQGIRQILKNEKYKGVLVTNKRHFDFEEDKVINIDKSEWKYFKDKVPAIVSDALWDKCNEIMNTRIKIVNEKVVGNFKGNHSLSSKIICGYCSNTYYHIKGGSSGRTKPRWSCSSQLSKGRSACIESMNVGHDDLVKIIRQEIEKIAPGFKIQHAILCALLNSQLQTSDGNQEEVIYNKRISELNKLKSQNEKLIDMYMNDRLTNAQYDMRRADNNKRIFELELELKNKPSKIVQIQTRKQRIDEILSIFERLSGVETDKLSEDKLGNIVQKVVVMNKKLTIFFSDDVFVERSYERKKGWQGSTY